MYRRSLTNLKLAVAGYMTVGTLAVGTMTAGAMVNGGLNPTVLPSPSVVAASSTVEVKDDSSRMATFLQADGKTAFALSLKAKFEQPTNSSSNVLILVDTSASQTGLFGQDSLAMAKAILDGLSPQDKVQLAAVDLDAVSLSGGFFAPTSKEIRSALTKLEERSPLGSTDINEVLKWSTKQFASLEANTSRHIIYVGDGISNATFTKTNQLEKIVKLARKHQSPISSFAIGPKRNLETLSILANQTGGNIFVDSDKTDSIDSGSASLVSTVRSNVIWPTEADSEGRLQEVFPKNLVPLRSDRDSILLGTVKSGESFKLSVEGVQGSKTVKQSWTIRPEQSSKEFGFLSFVVDQARHNEGTRLPTVGSEGLQEVARLTQNSASGLVVLAKRAERMGNSETAQRLVTAAIERSPNHSAARTFQTSLGKVAAQDTFQEAFQQQENQVGNAAIQTADQEHSSYLSKVRTTINFELKNAKTEVNISPARVVNRLKNLLEEIRGAADIPVDVKSKMIGEVSSQLSAAQGALAQSKSKEIIEARRKATIQQNVDSVNRLAQQNEKTTQMVRQLQSLLAELDHTESFENYNIVSDKISQLGDDIQKADPNSGISAIAQEKTHIATTLQQGRIRYREYLLGAANAWISVEQSGVPFDDRKPVVYPSRERWQELKRMRAKYDRVALLEEGGREQEIQRILSQTYDLKTGTDPISLKDFFDKITERYDLTIRIDKAVTEDIGLDPEGTEIVANFNGVSLGNAIKLALSDAPTEEELSYTVKNEVLTITTKDDESAQITLVYDVADLVLPLQPQQGGFGGGGFGGGQQGGGFGGGQGGGFGGGQGGGFGGGGGGFGGGGAFAVQDKTFNRKAGANSQESNKQEKTVILKVEIGAKENLKKAWSRFFRDNFVKSSSIVSTVRRKIGRKKFEEAQAILLGALANDQGRPWMYQALYVSSVAMGAPKNEIERLVMSTLDKTQDDELTLNLAKFMLNNDMEKRAVRVLKDLSLRNPNISKAFELSSSYVLENGTTEDIQWFTSGVLSRVWPNNQEIVDLALQSGAKHLIKLEKEGRTEEYKELNSKLVESMKRDCIIRLSWVGNADIDLQVIEPTGTVCSQAIPKTVSGGYLLNDDFADPSSNKSKIHEEYYACPKGFSGDYRLVIKPIRGKVSGDKVNVEIIRNFGSKNQTAEGKQLSFDGVDPIGVQFNLAHGRRNNRTDLLTTTLASHLIETQRQLIQEKMDNATDEIDQNNGSKFVPGILAGGRNKTNPYPTRRSFRPNLFRRGVGYRPEIQQIPSGPRWSGTAFTSHDRMYVFVNSNPQFTAVTGVSTFTFAGGDTGTTGQTGGAAGGTGGAGGGFGGGGGTF